MTHTYINRTLIKLFPNCRGGDRYGHDLSRRHRHQSGLALPAISDSFDAFELLGLDRTETGQVSFLPNYKLESSELISPVFAAFMITLLHDTYLDMTQDYGKQNRFDQAEII